MSGNLTNLSSIEGQYRGPTPSIWPLYKGERGMACGRTTPASGSRPFAGADRSPARSPPRLGPAQSARVRVPRLPATGRFPARPRAATMAPESGPAKADPCRGQRPRQRMRRRSRDRRPAGAIATRATPARAEARSWPARRRGRRSGSSRAYDDRGILEPASGPSRFGESGRIK